MADEPPKNGLPKLSFLEMANHLIKVANVSESEQLTIAAGLFAIAAAIEAKPK